MNNSLNKRIRTKFKTMSTFLKCFKRNNINKILCTRSKIKKQTVHLIKMDFLLMHKIKIEHNNNNSKTNSVLCKLMRVKSILV